MSEPNAYNSYRCLALRVGIFSPEEGHRMVCLGLSLQPNAGTEREHAVVYLTPAEARETASMLHDMTASIEGNRPTTACS